MENWWRKWLTSELIHKRWNVALFLPLSRRIWVTCWHHHDGNSKSYIHLLKLPLPGWIPLLQIKMGHGTWDLYLILTRAVKVNWQLSQTGKSQNGVTYNNCLQVGLSNRLVQSVKECCRHLAHSLHVGEQPVYIHNLTEHKENIYIKIWF